MKNSTTIHTQYVDTTGRPVPSWPPQKCPGSYTMRDFCLGRGYQVISLVLRSRTRELAQIENCMSRTILLFPGEFTYRIVCKIVSECPCRRMFLHQATWSVIDVWYRLTRTRTATLLLPPPRRSCLLRQSIFALSASPWPRGAESFNSAPLTGYSPPLICPSLFRATSLESPCAETRPMKSSHLDRRLNSRLPTASSIVSHAH
jgi:hypothetical protein